MLTDQYPPISAADVPIAFIVFNRPEVTRKVFAAIKAMRPKILLIVADGPRASRSGEAERVQEVRAIVSEVDWPCDVRRNYALVNMGCKVRVSSGLDWVFRQVDSAVILEDDCLPGKGFLPYCAALLAQYRDNRKVYAISGSNFSRVEPVAGHYFSNYSLMWGWATWADRWQDYRIDSSDYRAVLPLVWSGRPLVFLYWRKIFKNLSTGRIDTWDYQWMLTVWRNRGLVARPTKNLVKNIGFSNDATHTTDLSAKTANVPLSDVHEGFDRPVAGMFVDLRRDKVDEREWAVISIRAIVLMYFPWLSIFRRGK